MGGTRWWQRILGGQQSWAVIDGAVVAGCILARRIGRRKVLITWLYVIPEFRRRGFAARLLRIAISELFNDGYERIRLHVEVGNPARDLYEQHGFTVSRPMPEHYGKGRDGLRMEISRP